MTEIRYTPIQDVRFEQPDPIVLKQLRQYSREEHLKIAVLTSVILLILMIGLAVPAYRPFVILPIFIVLIIWVPYMKNLLFMPKYTVRYGTVLEHRREQEIIPGSDSYTTRHYITIRLDGTGETVQNLPVDIRLLKDVPTDRQLVLCKHKNQYILYPPVKHAAANEAR